MSKETSEWLNGGNILIGMTVERGEAWWYRASAQADDGLPTHYDYGIPIEDVKSRLFGWEALKVPAYFGKPVRDDDGNLRYNKNGTLMVRPTIDPDRCYVLSSDDDTRFSQPTSDWEAHQFSEWLLENVGTILGQSDDGSELVISSAGLLEGRAVAWVEVSVPETMQENGVSFRPNLLAFTSHNQTRATTYALTSTATVCDNTLNIASNEAERSGKIAKYRHSKNSGERIEEAREALGLIVANAEETKAAIRHYTDAPMTSGQWELILKTVVPMPGKSQRGDTRAANTRETIDHLLSYDVRVAPWKDCMFGAFQAVNTFNHHVRTVHKGTERAERNMRDTLNGNLAALDAATLAVIDQAMAGTLSDPDSLTPA